MWINDVSLGDFGCFDHARIDDLQDGVNVMAGPQRAGKTTFMHAVRHLGYKIPRDGSVPPATTEYSLGATVTTEGSEAYRIDVTGHGTQTVSPVDDGPDRTIEELYADLRKAQYHQLYTISLDELRQSPRSLDDAVSLAEVLLGGAFGDVVKLPQHRDAFESAADAIGGKHGRGVYELKDPIQRIEEGVEERKAATEQVDEYEEVESRVADRSARLDEIEADRDALELERTLLSAIAARDEEIRELRQLERELADADETALDAFPSDRVDTIQGRLEAYRGAREEATDRFRTFDTTTTVDDANAYLDRLQTHRADVERQSAELSGLRERVNQLREDRTAVRREWDDLRRRAAELNAAWDGDPDAVRKIETDAFASDEVQRITNACAEAARTLEEAKSDLEAARNRVSSLDAELGDAREEQTEATGFPIVIAGGGALLGLALGLGAGVLVGLGAGLLAGSIAGVGVTFLVLAVAGAVAYRRIETPSGTTAVQKLEADLRSARAAVDQRRTAIADAEEVHEEARDEFRELCETLGLPVEMAPGAVERFHADARSLKSDVDEAERREENCRENTAALREDLSELAEVLVALGTINRVPDEPIDEAERLFATLDRLADHADIATDVRVAREEARAARAELVDELDAWAEAPDLNDATDDEIDATARKFLQRAETVAELQDERESRRRLRLNLRAAFEQGAVASALSTRMAESDAVADGGGQSDGLPVLERIERVVEGYGDLRAIEARVSGIDDRLDELEAEAEELRNERAELRKELEDLKSSDDVNEAHETIQRGRRDLIPLAEEYATDRIAEYFLDELYDRFLDRTTGPLLDDASAVFERITDGTYDGIRTQEDLEELDFTALLAGGGSQSPDELSRATVEQLFLAIRIARIQRESRPLPVILDDSFTNFDPKHRHRTLQVLDELAETNQVFLLTCHPEFVDTVSNAGVEASYWRLEDGTFERADSPADAASILQPTQ